MSLAYLIGGVELTQRFGASGQDVGSSVGTASFTMLNDDPQNSLCDYGVKVEVRLDGTTIFWFRIDTIEPVEIAENEGAGEATTYSGPTRSLKEAIVYPSKGVYQVPEGQINAGLRIVTKPFSDDRYLGWMEPGFDDSAWPSAVEVLAPTGSFRPEGFPDPAAKWIWFEASVAYAHPVGQQALFRRTFTTVSDLVFAIHEFHAGLDQIDEMYLDGESIDLTDFATDGNSGQHARESIVQINGDLPHTLAVKVSHLVPGLAGFLCSIYENGTSTVLQRTSSTWKCIDAADLDSMTPGGAMIQLLDEWDARGGDTVARSFTAAVDTRGDTWPAIVGDFALRVLDGYDMVLDQLAESYIEWAFLPEDGGDELSMWIGHGVDAPGGAGVGRGGASGVTFAEGVNCTGLSFQGTDEVKTVGLIRWGDGFIEGIMADALATYGRREAGISIGNVKSGPSALWTAYATLQPISAPGVSVVIGIEPEDNTDTPYLAFGIGDTVTAPDQTGAPTTYRVAAISWSEDDDGYVTWFVELGTARDLQAQRWERWLKRTANGTLDGRSRSATPTSPSIQKSGKVNVVDVTFSTSGDGEALVGDIGTKFRPRETLLFYRTDIEFNVAGTSGDTTIDFTIDFTPQGEEVTAPDGADEGYHDFATPILVTKAQLVNIEVTEAGGHVGGSLVAKAVAI